MRHDARRARDGAKDSAEIRDRIRHGNIADALARQRERLAVRITDERIIVVFRDVRHGQAIECDFAIRLVRNDEDRMTVFLLFLLEDSRKLFDRFFRIDGTARIVRRIDDDSFRMRVQQLFKRLTAEAASSSNSPFLPNAMQLIKSAACSPSFLKVLSTANVYLATAILPFTVCEYLTSGSLTTLPHKITRFITFPHFLITLYCQKCCLLHYIHQALHNSRQIIY